MSGMITDALLLQFERDVVVDVVADVLFAGQHLVDGSARPMPTEVSSAPIGVQQRGDLAFSLMVVDEESVDLAGRCPPPHRSRHQDDAVGLQALLFAAGELAFGSPLLSTSIGGTRSPARPLDESRVRPACTGQ